MKKKVMASVLAAAMVLSLAACGNDGGSESSAQSSQGSSAASSAASSTGSESSSGSTETAEGYFPLKDSVTVTIAGRREDAEKALSERQFFKDLEEQTNLKIDWIDWPGSQFNEKLGLAFSGGTFPDAMMGNFILSTTELVQKGAEGWLMTWNDYINEEYMPNFYDLCQRAPGLLESITAEDGNIYGLPQFDMVGLSITNDTLVINTEWLKKVEKEMPTTIEEFYDVLKAFKDYGDLNGNGKADEIPFTFQFNAGNNGQLSFMGFTGLAYNTQHERICYKDGKVVYVPQEEEYKEFLTYMHRLYSEGLIDPECFTMDASTYNAKTQTSEPTCGVISIWDAARVNAPIEGNDPEKDGVYQYLAPLDGENGRDPVWIPRYTPYNRAFCFVVSADTDYKEELVRWADLFYDLDTSIMNSKGVVGVHIEEKGDHVYEAIKKEDGSNWTTVEKSEYITMDDGMYGIAEGDCEMITHETPQSKAAANPLYEPYFNPNHVYTYALMSEEEAELDSLLKPELKKYVDTWTTDFITNGKIDERWDEYVNGLQKLRVDEFIELYEAVGARSSRK